MHRHLALALTLLVLALGGTAAASARTGEAGFWGVSTPFLYDGTKPEKREKHLTRIARMGAGVARIAISWNEVESRAPRRATRQWEWQWLDNRIAMLAGHGLRAYPALNDTPHWARAVGAGRFGPPRPQYIPYFASFAAELALRYGPNGSFWATYPELPYRPILNWEIWNEPNNEFFWGEREPKARRYAKMLLAAHDAITLAQPGARVVMGGLSGSAAPEAYLRQMLLAEPALVEKLGYVGFHPYGANAKAGMNRLARFRDALDRRGLADAAIEVTEDGMSTRDDERRRSYLTQMSEFVQIPALRVSRYVVHTWVTREDKRAEPEHWYGIANRGGSLKGSGRALQRVIATSLEQPRAAGWSGCLTCEP